MADPVEIVVRGADGRPVGRIAVGGGDPPVVEVLDEAERTRVEAIAAFVTRRRAPRPRPSCAPRDEPHSGGGSSPPRP